MGLDMYAFSTPLANVVDENKNDEIMYWNDKDMIDVSKTSLKMLRSYNEKKRS